MEIWKDIKGYEGLYQVSNFGRIKSFVRNVSNPRIMKTYINRKGYIKCYIGGKSKSIHRLAVKQFDKCGNLICRYNSVQEAARITRIWESQISACCRHDLHTKSAGGYFWEYEI